MLLRRMKMLKEMANTDLFAIAEEALKSSKISDRIYMLHCISSDLGMGAGIAKPINLRYNCRTKIDEGKYAAFGGEPRKWDNKGYCIVNAYDNESIEESRMLIVNLVTKKNYWDKPTYTTLSQSLLQAREFLLGQKEGVHNQLILMPRIGCGLDKLRWNHVREIIATEFDQNTFKIVECYL